jgi:hypothetical protein
MENCLISEIKVGVGFILSPKIRSQGYAKSYGEQEVERKTFLVTCYLPALPAPSLSPALSLVEGRGA